MELTDTQIEQHLIIFTFFSQISLTKLKNHFSEIKGDVGMSCHEKEGEQEDACTETGSY